MKIGFESVTVGESRRIRIYAPFEVKDAIKAVGGRWERARNYWTVAHTSVAIKMVSDSISAFASEPVEFRYADAACEETASQPSSVLDVTEVDFDDSVLPPWPHQKQGASMIGQMSGCMLAWDMGSGKSKAVCDAVVRFGFSRTIICCPTSVIRVWSREFKKHVKPSHNLVFVALDGSLSVADRAKVLLDKCRECYQTSRPIVAAINYEAVWREAMSKIVCKIPWDLAVADESHRISSPSTRIGKFMTKKLGPHAKHRVALTGTPMSNGPLDVFGQFLFCEPGLFGAGFTRFRSRYCIMGGFEGRQVVDHQNLPELTALMGTVSTRVKLNDVVDLPPFRDEEIVVELCKDAATAYCSLRDDFIAEFGQSSLVAVNAITKLLRLQQITSGYAMVVDDDSGDEEARQIEIDSSKSNALKDIISSVAPGEPVVVFCRFVHDLQETRRVAAGLGRRVWEISGNGNEQEEWEADCDLGLGPIIAVQIQSGGVGIDLTRARYCVYYSLGFSLTDYVQSRARVYRPGQNRGVIYYHLIAKGTVDRVVYHALKTKQKVVDVVVESLTKGGDNTIVD